MKKRILITSTLFMALLFCSSASAGNFTTDDEVWYSTPYDPPTLYAYNTTSNTTRTVAPLEKTYGDIAWGADGNLYGVSTTTYTIDRINTTNGQATVLTNVNGFYNSMASDDLGWLYIGYSSSFQRYNIYSGISEEWINTANYGISGTVTGDCAFIDDDFYATYYNQSSNFLIKITGLDANHRVTGTTSASIVINNLPDNAYGLTRGSNNDLYFTAWAGEGPGIYRILLSDNTVSLMTYLDSENPWGVASRIYPPETNPLNPVYPPVNNTEQNIVNAATVGMQKTGIPIAGLILAFLMLFGGLANSKRK